MEQTATEIRISLDEIVDKALYKLLTLGIASELALLSLNRSFQGFF